MLTRALQLCVVTAIVGFAGCGGKTPDTVSAPTPDAEPAAAKVPTPPAPVVPDLTEAVRVDAPEYGTLTVKVPGGGKVDLPKPEPGDPTSAATVSFASGLLTQLRVTVLGPVELTPGFGLDESLKRELAVWAASLKGKIMEGELTPELFEAGPIRGYCVLATDTNPAAGDPKFLVNGFFRAGDGVFMLGGLSNDAPGAKAELLAVAKTATWEAKAKPDEAHAGSKAEESQPTPGKS